MFTDPHLAPRPANFRPLTPLGLLERTLEVRGPWPALVWRDLAMDWNGFGAMVARMACWLRGLGVGPGDVVSIMATNRPELAAAHFAVPALGAVLNAVNIRLDAAEVAWILDHAGARLLILDPAVAAPADPPAPVWRLCARPGAGDGLDFFDGPAPPLDPTAAIRDEHQPIALNYTSGTTGRPKGVVYTHRGAFLNAVGNLMAFGFDRATRYLWTLPMFHCNGWCHVWAVTAAGGTHVCLDRPEPAAILSAIADHGVTHMSCAPVVLYMLLEHGAGPVASRVRVATGGAPPTPALLQALTDRGFDVVHMYGLTESYGPATFNDPADDPEPDPEARLARMARQGRRHAMAGRARVLGPDGAEVAPDGGTVGEIALAGNTVMAGYYRDPEATERAFAGGVFRSGDVAVTHPDGQIEIRDRAKDIIITGGENVSSIEIETVLHRHPAVLLAAVVAAPDPKWGETPWAFVELRSGATVTAEELDALCRQGLAGFKRPRRYVFGPLPRTGTGKIQKFLLREQARGMAGR
ncbi:MAG: AMP-binding protein [Rubrimonas sp.]